MIVLDASALLSWLQNETGAGIVDSALVGSDCAVSAANWSEVAQKSLQRDGAWIPARALLLSYDLSVVPMSESDAEMAAELWSQAPRLSLADRVCLALTVRLDATALTADREWARSPLADRVRLIR